MGDRSIEARVLNVNVTRDEVELELPNRQRKKVKSSIFSEEDQDCIRDCAIVQVFQSQRFKIEVEINVLDKRKEKVGPRRAILRDTETICYDINISNNTDVNVQKVIPQLTTRAFFGERACFRMF